MLGSSYSPFARASKTRTAMPTARKTTSQGDVPIRMATTTRTAIVTAAQRMAEVDFGCIAKGTFRDVSPALLVDGAGRFCGGS